MREMRRREEELMEKRIQRGRGKEEEEEGNDKPNIDK